jgi:hypothetical protein
VIRDAAQPAFDSPDSESDITTPGRLARLLPVEAAAGNAIIGKPVTIGDVEVFTEVEKRSLNSCRPGDRLKVRPYRGS